MNTQVPLPITNVEVFPLRERTGKLMGYARVLIADQLQLTGLRIFDGSKGLFVSYPNDPYHKGEEYRQIFFPTTGAFRSAVEEAVLQKYEHMINDPFYLVGGEEDA